MKKRVYVHIQGRVQGVGFRPFVYRQARSCNITGFVCNDPRGVTVEAEGSAPQIRRFLASVRTGRPPASRIERIETSRIPLQGTQRFIILPSARAKEKFVFLAPDLSICSNCTKELTHRDNRRYGYPFINCTDCGPRYSITKDIPYDRKKTTMKSFTLCERCAQEYRSPLNRRFHAQPNACFDCGPSVGFMSHHITSFGRKTRSETGRILHAAARLICAGKIVAIKGIGGYHLCCDAINERVVSMLRQRKKRPSKPFALMMDDMAVVQRFCRLGAKEKQLLMSPARPIVLLSIKKFFPWMDNVAPGQRFLGVMLCYTPLHLLLFSHLRRIKKTPVLVMTSANAQDEPLAKNEKEIQVLSPLVDGVLYHNRPIHVRCDDSITRAYHGKEYLVRKARGYVPDFFEFRTAHRILACGAELKSTFSLTTHNYLVMSPYLGDLKSQGTYSFFLETLSHFQKIFGFTPEAVAFDMHPAYRSAQYARSLRGIKKIPIQHHHAHAASCMLENRIRGKVIGVVFDGVGFGTDEAVWGGEFFVCDLHRFRRIGSFDYFGLVGKDKAVEEPWRVACYILNSLYGKRMYGLTLPFTGALDKKTLELLMKLIEKKQYIRSSSVGRMFDAAASILGLRQKVTYEAEAAVALEMLALRASRKSCIMPYKFDIIKKKGCYRIGWQRIFDQLITEAAKGGDISRIAYAFHETLAFVTARLAVMIRRQEDLNTVVLSGGVFQNRLLLSRTLRRLREVGFTVCTHSRFPPNDSCISAGQAAVAQAHLAKRR